MPKQDSFTRFANIKQLALIMAALLATLAMGAHYALAQSDTTPDIATVSNRADLVSGGDVLVRVTLPSADAQAATLSLNGKAIPAALHPAPDGRGFLSLVTGLNPGRNLLAISSRGVTEQLDVANHPVGGPVFSGPHLQPWACTTMAAGLGAPQDLDCNAPPQFAFFYKNNAAGEFVPYDPANPPAPRQIAIATTDQGKAVPYIIRQETGAINRAIYKITVLFDPARPWTPWEPQPAWNGKLVYLFGGGAGNQYTQGSLTNGFDDAALSRGFATAAATLTNEGTVTNAQLNAETLMMVKERLANEYGVIRYTIGNGCSGGAIQQHSIGDQYPGLLDGLIPTCSYPDMWSLVVNGHDCQVLTHYFTSVSPTLWANAVDREAILGQPSEQECPGEDGPSSFGGRWFPVGNPSCLIPPANIYNPQTNRLGARCGMKDYHVNELGMRPQDGYAYEVFDSLGVQYGLKPLLAGKISPEQFVDLNEKVGGLDIDGGFQAQRTAGDLKGVERMYQTGLITYGRELAKYPIIDARGDDNFEMHNNSEWIFTRNRILRANGSAPNQIHWWTNEATRYGMPPPEVPLKSLELMDRWLAAIESDTSSSPHETKVARNRPAEAHDACTVDGKEYPWTRGSICDKQFTFTGLIRMAAGGPNTNDVLKCQLKPLKRSDYAVTFTEAQWSRLQQTFPQGVCDYSKPGVGQQPPSAPWLTFGAGPGGMPLGPPPAAHKAAS